MDQICPKTGASNQMQKKGTSPLNSEFYNHSKFQIPA